MDLSSHYKMLALYNQRINNQLLSVCANLSSAQLHQDTNSFFVSVMAYWNHILFGDLIMLQRMVVNDLVNVDADALASLPIAKDVNDTFVTTLNDLEQVRSLVDQIYVGITQDFTDISFDQAVIYKTTEGQTIEKKLGEFIAHIFNHQTHHRGQLTCILSQFDLDFGCTDLPVIVPEGYNT